MKELSKLNKDLKDYLNNSTPIMVEDLKNILCDKSIIYLKGKTKADSFAYYFEYEYDDLDIVFWAVNNKNKIIVKPLILPTQKDSKKNEKKNRNSFMPKKIQDKVNDFENNYDEDDLYDIIDSYNKEKYNLFEEWFCNCWKQAVKESGIKMEAYFSIHDTIFKTDLNTLKEIRLEEIEKRNKKVK